MQPLSNLSPGGPLLHGLGPSNSVLPDRFVDGALPEGQICLFCGSANQLVRAVSDHQEKSLTHLHLSFFLEGGVGDSAF